MFGIGFPELIVILILALVVLGPKQIPQLAKSLGKGIAELRRMSDELKSSIEDDLVKDETTKEKRQRIAGSETLHPNQKTKDPSHPPRGEE